MQSRKDTMMPAQLDLWNDGVTKQAIVNFVTKVTTASGPDFVPPAERIAVFDNDGTLWCEKPMYIQLDFILRRWLEMANQNSALRDQQPWKAAVEKDYAWLGNAVTKHYSGDDSDMPVLMKGLLTAFEGSTIEDFAQRAGDFLRTQMHPTLKRMYRECGYTPMIELLRYLEANGFTNFIVSGGGRDFMRPITQDLYGIPAERVVGSSVSLEFRENGDGGDVLTQPHLDVLDDGPVKPIRIWSRIGKRPILAAGNSNGDIQMLQFANKPPRPALRLLVLHDDAKREFDYVAGAEKSLALAQQYGWTIVSIRNDWKTVFGDE
jgi:phosphoserine phosphatase